MGMLDFFNGIDKIIDEAESLYYQGRYKEALNKTCINDIQALVTSKEQYVRMFYLNAKCFYALKEYKSAIDMLDIVIDYPDYNHNYISKAESLKKEIQEYV